MNPEFEKSTQGTNVSEIMKYFVNSANTYQCKYCNNVNEITEICILELHKGNRFLSSCKGCNMRAEIKL